jgi:hypothetical protein
MAILLCRAACKHVHLRSMRQLQPLVQCACKLWNTNTLLLMSTQTSQVEAPAVAVAVAKQNKTSTPGRAAVNSKTAEWRKNSWRKKRDLAVIKTVVSKGQWVTARQSLADMKAAGTVPDAQAYSRAAALCNRHGTLAEAQTLLQEISDAGHSSDLAMCLLQLKVASRQFIDGGIGSLDDVITAFQAIEQSGFEPTELSYDRKYYIYIYICLGFG